MFNRLTIHCQIPTDRQNVPERDKRSSMNRPVLQLQVKQETLERQKIKTNGGNIHMVSKGTLRNIARESGICAGRCADRARTEYTLVSIMTIRCLLLASCGH